MRKRYIALVVLLVVALSLQIVYACSPTDRGIGATAHWHQTIPIVGNRWPCVEGWHRCLSAENHSVQVTLLVTQDGVVRINTAGTRYVAGSAQVFSATGLVTSTGHAHCPECPSYFPDLPPAEDNVW